jgi:hypothetical protein
VSIRETHVNKRRFGLLGYQGLEIRQGLVRETSGEAPDTNPMNELYEWQFAGRWLQLVEDKKRAGSSSVTFEAANRPKGGRRAHARRKLDVVILADSDGNQIVFAHGKAESHRAVK